MSITKESDYQGILKAGEIVAFTLKEMKDHARPGMTTKQLDDYGASILQSYGARSAPNLTYGFPGWTCISVNHEFCHGIPSARKILKDGDLVNIDVSAEINGFFADNGNSFVIGNDIYNHQKLIDASKSILYSAIDAISHDIRISEIGHRMEKEAAQQGYKVIKNLAGHGIGKSLHESPHEVLNYYDPFTKQKFKNHSVIAVETFISTTSDYVVTARDKWTLLGDQGGFMAQHEHTILVTDRQPIILTKNNGV